MASILETDFDKRVESDMANKTPMTLQDCWKLGFKDSGTIRPYAEYRVRKEYTSYDGTRQYMYNLEAAFYPAEKPELIPILGGSKTSVLYYYPDGDVNKQQVFEDPSYEDVVALINQIKTKYGL